VALAGAVARADCDAYINATTVLFVTDRAALQSEQLFSGERANTPGRLPFTTYGVIGSSVSLATEHICSSREAFLDAVRKRFSATSARKALIYTHGYYRTFKQGAETTLAMQKALHFAGPVILYSWPSKVTSRLTYMNDESNASWSVPHFVDLVTTLERTFPQIPISFVSHSMGGRFATAGLEYFRRIGCTLCLGRSVFFAPDVDSDTLFDEFSYSGLCTGPPAASPAAAALVTLYVSNRDTALRDSQGLHGHQRAGEAGSDIILCSGVDTIDVSYVSGSDSAGHTYQTYPQILADTAAAFAGYSPRSPKRALKVAHRSNGQYYELRP
jgi:esterase/lipase superfamily enzyme